MSEEENLFPKGTVVRLSRAYRKQLRWAVLRIGKTRLYYSRRHVREFGRCEGKVIGPTNYGNGIFGPEVDVRWFGVGRYLRYSYHPENLDILTQCYSDGQSTNCHPVTTTTTITCTERYHLRVQKVMTKVPHE